MREIKLSLLYIYMSASVFSFSIHMLIVPYNSSSWFTYSIAKWVVVDEKHWTKIECISYRLPFIEHNKKK